MIPIKRKNLKVVGHNDVASSQSNMSEKPLETNEVESCDSSEESDCSSCPECDKPLESYYCKCCHIKTYSDNDDKYMEERILCWDCYSYVRKAIQRNRVY